MTIIQTKIMANQWLDSDGDETVDDQVQLWFKAAAGATSAELTEAFAAAVAIEGPEGWEMQMSLHFDKEEGLERFSVNFWLCSNGAILVSEFEEQQGVAGSSVHAFMEAVDAIPHIVPLTQAEEDEL
jgi:hypothetical protein